MVKHSNNSSVVAVNVRSAERAVKQIAVLEWIYLQKNAFFL